MTMPVVEFLFDFGSPNAYLAHKVIPAIEARTGARFSYVPVLLGGVFKATGNRSPMEAFASIPAKMSYEGLERDRFVRRHGLTRFVANPHFPVNTLAMMRGAVAARTLLSIWAVLGAILLVIGGAQMPELLVLFERLDLTETVIELRRLMDG